MYRRHFTSYVTTSTTPLQRIHSPRGIIDPSPFFNSRPLQRKFEEGGREAKLDRLGSKSSTAIDSTPFFCFNDHRFTIIHRPRLLFRTAPSKKINVPLVDYSALIGCDYYFTHFTGERSLEDRLFPFQTILMCYVIVENYNLNIQNYSKNYFHL